MMVKKAVNTSYYFFFGWGEGGGGQKVMTVLFIRENVDNYGWPLNKKK